MGQGTAKARKLGEAAQAYQGNMEARKLRAGTVKVTMSTVNRAVVVIGAHRWCSQLGEADFRDYFYGDADGKFEGVADLVSGNTFNDYRGRVSGFETFMRKARYITVAPPFGEATFVAGIPKLPGEENEPYRLSEDEYHGLLSTAGAYDPRDRAYMALGMTVATRGQEASRILLGHVSDDLSRIKVLITKSKTTAVRWRTVELPPSLVAELSAWLVCYAAAHRMSVPQLMRQTDWHLFPSRHVSTVFGTVDRVITYRPTEPVGVPHEVVNRHLHAMGIHSRRTGFHTLRRSGARLLYDWLTEQGKANALRLVQILLNHTSQIQTAHYIGLDADRDDLHKTWRGSDYLADPRREVRHLHSA